ncbi:MAG: hydantoinase B/oxoprolinase family protein [Betaproteobacteria bacterium]|nr:hydantoinase B/oxoprolinase family protein [Betaproteobacteria bacterium]
MAAPQATKRVCIDVGGTFTDCLVMEETGLLEKFKASTTPSDPTQGFMDAMGKAARHYGVSVGQFLGQIEVLVHGTTLATNVMLTGRGAKVGMLTTKNFRDMLEIRRAIRPTNVSLYNLFIPPNRPLIPRSRRIGVEERTLYTGEIATPLNEKEAAEAVMKLKGQGVESIAVSFLHSYANPANELRAAAICREIAPEIFVTTSHETLPVWREFERFSTTAVGAYVGPAVGRYLTSLDRALKESGFRGTFLVMLANGLVQNVRECMRRPVFLLHSGPAAAPSGAVHLGRHLGSDKLLSIDMGGTSFDVCLINNGEIPATTEHWESDQRVAIKMVDISSIGAGGGSIARVDSLGLLRVGPESAGAEPGPACYGRGKDATVTDANLVLGYVPADYFLGGEMAIDAQASRNAMRPLGERLGMSETEVAEAIFRTVNANMADKITEVSTKRGHDVRDCVMIAGGGGGAIHAGFIADSLGVRKVVVPPVAALYSAFGMFSMDIGQDYARSFVSRADSIDLAALNRVYGELEAEALASFKAHGISAKDVTFKRTADMRYVGQFHEVEADVANGTLTQEHIAATVAFFGRKHEELYTFSMPWKQVDMLTLRLKATAPRAPFSLPEAGRSSSTDAGGALKRRRTCRFGGRDVDTPVYDGEKVLAGNVIRGPAVIEETTTTVVIPEAYICSVDKHKNYVLTRVQEARANDAAEPASKVIGKPRVDATTVATVWHSMQTICKEMRHLVDRTAQNYLMGQLHDLSVGIWGADGSAIAVPVGLPVQFLGTTFAVQDLVKNFAGNINPGDLFLTNDPYHGGHNCHLPDWGFFRPIFYKGELLFFTLCRGHQMDTGGSFPGGYFPNGFDIHAEGICIPPIKVYDRGRERADVINLILNNVRFRDGVRIDLQAMIGATVMCERRMTALLDTYGKETVFACVEEMLLRTEKAVHEEIRKIPDGVYTGAAATDDDGTVLDEQVWVRTRVTVAGEELSIDFSESDGQRKGFINSVYAATYGNAIAAALLYFDPALADYHNQGTMASLKVIAPTGLVVNCQYPATVGASPVNVGNQVMEAVIEALSKAMPHRGVAAWAKHRGDYTFAVDPRSGERYVRTTFDYDGSGGAVWGFDGYPGLSSMTALGAVTRGNVEEEEIRLPWRLLKYEFVSDFTGAGRWRGGPGVHWEALNEGSAGQMATGSSDGDVVQGCGAVGGLPSPVCRTYMRRNGEEIRIKPHRMMDVKERDILVKHSSGGGGVGNPAQRDPEMVREDVENELVSVSAAKEIYKVVIDPVSRKLDIEATKALRARS